MSAARCEWELLAQGPRCCREAGHEGAHHYRCSGPYCPGLTYPASVLRHPESCTSPARKADPPGLELLGTSDAEARATFETARIARTGGAGELDTEAARGISKAAIEDGADDAFNRAADALAGAFIERGEREAERHRRRFTLGVRVKALRGFSGVPMNTVGVVDEHYTGGLMVAWDLEDRPLRGADAIDGAKAYAESIRGGYKPLPQFAMGAPLRDGFAYEELKFLEVLEEEAPDGAYEFEQEAHRLERYEED